MCAHDSGNALGGVIDAQAFIGARRTSFRQSSAIATCRASPRYGTPTRGPFKRVMRGLPW
ncbi:hypothetical protein [Paraburkholderia bannensis]|uniref:hypothetical protein n=1 Tax=Paraburkholderia bannensis TaxID=765414 RepID=UPI002ABE7ED8|nr:hypothetical protein [Paraburkholderia bannensis]